MAWLDDIEATVDAVARGVRPMPGRWPVELLDRAPLGAVRLAAEVLQRDVTTTAGHLQAWRLLYAELLERRGDPEPLAYVQWRRQGARGQPGPWRRMAHALLGRPGPGAWQQLVAMTPGDTQVDRMRRITERLLLDGIDHDTLVALLDAATPGLRPDAPWGPLDRAEPAPSPHPATPA